VGTIIAF
jgi:hypothetical protein